VLIPAAERGTVERPSAADAGSAKRDSASQRSVAATRGGGRPRAPDCDGAEPAGRGVYGPAPKWTDIEACMAEEPADEVGTVTESCQTAIHKVASLQPPTGLQAAFFTLRTGEMSRSPDHERPS
jgi:hypothetical protein